MGIVLDLTREEGARVLEEDLLLYNEAENIKELIKKFLDLKTPNKDRDGDAIIEFFATNIFVSGGRGTGKTSILLTLEKELREEAKNKCEILPIINLSVNYTGIIFYLLSYFKGKVEEEFKPTSCCSSSELWELLDKLINNFPKFLKCFCNNDCSYLCNEELEILLDQHEIKFLENFYKFLDEILDSKHLILILDDIDLIPDSKILLRTFLELAVFLNHPKTIIIGAGDIENLKIRLLKALKKNIGDNNCENPNNEKLYEEMVLALIDKIFPINNRIFLQKISPHILDKLKLKISSDFEKEKDFKEFIKEHPTFGLMDKNYRNIIVKYLFSDISLREFVQILRTIERQIDLIKETNSLRVKDILISRIFLNLYFDSSINLLKTNFDIKIKLNIEKSNNDIKIINTGDIRELETANFEAFKSFVQVLEGIIRKANIDYLETNRDILSVIYAYNPKLSQLLQLWAWEINLYLKGHIYFYPLAFLTFLIIQGLAKTYLDKDGEEGYIPPLKDFINSMLNNLTSKENFYTFLSISLADTVKAVQRLPKVYRNTLIFNLDVKNVNNYYPILKFFKGFVLITKLGTVETQEEIDDIWIIDFYNYKTLGELEDVSDIDSPSTESNTVINDLKNNLTEILKIINSNNISNIPINNKITLQDLNFLSLAYYKGIETRFEKKSIRWKNIYYVLPFYIFLAFYISKDLPDRIFYALSFLYRKLKQLEFILNEGTPKRPIKEFSGNIKDDSELRKKLEEKFREIYQNFSRNEKNIISLIFPLICHDSSCKIRMELFYDFFREENLDIEQSLKEKLKSLISQAFNNTEENSTQNPSSENQQ